MLREVVQNAGLEAFAEVGIIVFFISFVAVVGRTFLTRNRDLESVRNLPLEGDEVHS